MYVYVYVLVCALQSRCLILHTMYKLYIYNVQTITCTIVHVCTTVHVHTQKYTHCYTWTFITDNPLDGGYGRTRFGVTLVSSSQDPDISVYIITLYKLHNYHYTFSLGIHEFIFPSIVHFSSFILYSHWLTPNGPLNLYFIN